jgi:hypothetical protein
MALQQNSGQVLAEAAGPCSMISAQHVYEVLPRKDHRGVDLISDVLPFAIRPSVVRRSQRRS